MCGRYTLAEETGVLIKLYRAKGKFIYKGSYNIAPTQLAPVLIEGEEGREIRLMKWGLLPHWAENEKVGTRMINARAETVAEKPAYRSAFKKSRCIIPASGFYEWNKEKQATYFSPKEGLFSFCGLWSVWKSPEGKDVETFCIVTTEANPLVAKTHDRMPVALGHNQIGEWLAADAKADDLKSFLRPYPASQMQARQVSKLVNSVKNNSPDCIKAAGE